MTGGFHSGLPRWHSGHSPGSGPLRTNGRPADNRFIGSPWTPRQYVTPTQTTVASILQRTPRSQILHNSGGGTCWLSSSQTERTSALRLITTGVWSLARRIRESFLPRSQIPSGLCCAVSKHNDP
ncbi:jg22879 [Pararge aegeria aegeria]|uniref:Jg22879 protein n=1 Tax=Pararge aegeria aegeria TaxID=348720 RepID=A0A8S4RYA2_9NEOP|nr:jg22879 [Pararge aegeria aegeria]